MWWKATWRCTSSSVAETVHHLTAPDGAGRIDRWLATALEMSRGRVQTLLDDGLVMVDGVEKGFYSVTEEDQERMSIEEHDAYAKLYAELA